MAKSKVLQVGIHDLGVLPREKFLNYLTSVNQDDAYRKTSRITITPDQNDEYNITESLISPIFLGALYDGTNKILEWSHHAGDCLIIESYTDKQVNLFANFKVKKCLIRATGPVFIQGKLEAKAIVAIEAEALWLAESLELNGSVLLNARQGVALLAPIRAEHLIINAAYVHQEAELQLTGQFDVSTQCFKQGALAKIRINSLRLIASQCEIGGDLLVTDRSFLVANVIIWGRDETLSTLQFLGISHIHASGLQIVGDTEVCLGHPDKNAGTVFVVEQTLVVDKAAVIDVFNARSVVNELDNYGEISLHRSAIEIKNLKQYGLLEAEQSQVTVASHLDHRNASTLLKKSHVASHKTSVDEGVFALDQCDYKGETCNLYSGSFELKNKSKIETITLSLSERISASVNDSSIKVQEKICSSAKLVLNQSDIDTYYLKSVKNKITICNNSQIRAQTQIELFDSMEVRDSCFYGGNVIFDGHLTIHNAKLYSNSLSLASEQAEISSLVSSSNSFHLQGSEKPNRVIFKDSQFSTQAFSSLSHATLKYCAIFGVSKENIGLSLKNLKLISCKFITENPVCIAVNSQLNLERFSVLKVGLLHSRGVMKARDSEISCTFLWQDKAKIEAESSTLSVQRTIFAQASQMQLKNSTLFTSLAKLQGSELNLQEGSMLVASTIKTNSSCSSD